MEQKIEVSIEKSGFIWLKGMQPNPSQELVHHFLITGLIQGEGLLRTFPPFQALRVRVNLLVILRTIFCFNVLLSDK